MNHFHYNRSNKGKAQSLRKQMTKAEKELWYQCLSKRQFQGLRFLRQRAIDRFIVDFFCPELKLIIEADGVSHHYDDAIAYDTKRQQRLEALGYQVLRFSDFEIFNQPDVVYGLLVEKVADLLSNQS